MQPSAAFVYFGYQPNVSGNGDDNHYRCNHKRLLSIPAKKAVGCFFRAFSKDLRIGDWVVIERAGEVIPQIVRSDKEKRTGSETPFTMPVSCPSCNGALVNKADEAAIYCTNATCPAQLERLVEHFVSKGAMDIEGMGGKVGVSLIQNGLIADVADIYFLQKDKLIQIERMGEKSADLEA